VSWCWASEKGERETIGLEIDGEEGLAMDEEDEGKV
jgi:hypothetical protein